jgi:biotin carboxyl carrier protein
MRKFNVNINGKTYAVEVDEVGSCQPSFTYAPVQPVQQEQPIQSAPVQPAPKAIPKAGETVSAPMPGTILDIKVSEGQAVKAGDVIVILEAMKMENEITAQKDGTVYINTTKGTTVNTGDALFTIA